MGIAKRQAFFHQVVGQIGGGGVAAQSGLLHGNRIDTDATFFAPGGWVKLAAQHFREDAQRVFEGVYRVKQRFFVFLVVFVVGQRLAFHEGDQAHQMPYHTPCFATREFRHIGVFFLRHDGTAGGEAVCNLDETKVLAHPQHQFLAHAADVHHAQAGGSGEFDGKVAVADGIQAVLTDLWQALRIDHAQCGSYPLAIQRVAGARQSRRAQRQAVDPGANLLQALGIAAEHFHISQHVVAKAYRLRHLQMGKAGHDHVGMALCHCQQRLLQVYQQSADQVNFTAQPEPHIGGHLVVATAPGVQALAGIAYELGQTGFDVQVHVFQVKLPVKLPRLDFLADLRHAALDVGQVLGADDGLCGQHAGVCQRACDVGLPQAFVKKHARGVALDQIAHGL